MLIASGEGIVLSADTVGIPFAAAALASGTAAVPLVVEPTIRSGFCSSKVRNCWICPGISAGPGLADTITLPTAESARRSLASVFSVSAAKSLIGAVHEIATVIGVCEGFQFVQALA